MKKLLLFICVLAVSAGAWAQGVAIEKYVKVTSTSDIEDGGKYIIVREADATNLYGAGVQPNPTTNYLTSNAFGTDGYYFNEVNTDGTPYTYTLSYNGSEETYYFINDGKYLTGTSGSTDLYLRTSPVAASHWTIAFSPQKNANITNKSTGRLIKYNSTTNPNRFNCPSSGGNVVVLYKYVPLTLNASGFSTFSYSEDVTISGATAYKAAVDGETITLTSIGTSIPANEGVILYGTAGANVTIASAASPVAPVEGNALKASSVAVEDGYVAWVLNGNQFLEYTGGVLAPNKAYIPRLATASANTLRLVFDNESTGIQSVQQNAVNNGVAYNLAGQRVAANVKGIVIVNGKKYINK